MKKIILTLLLIVISSSTFAQNITRLPKRVKVATWVPASSTDKIVSKDQEGFLNETQITVQQMTDAINGGGAQNLQQVTNEGSTTTNSITRTRAGSSRLSSDAFIIRDTGSNSTGSILFDNDGNDFRISQNTSGGEIGATSSLRFTYSSGFIPQPIDMLVLGTNSTSLNNNLTINSASNQLRLFDVSTNRGVTFNAQNVASNVILETPTESGKLALKKDTVAKISANTSSSDTNASLNAAYPIADNPLGTMVAQKFGSGLSSSTNLYVRITSTEWFKLPGSNL
ncbi:hypothetical protein M1M25_gp081 [Tenacibaculum phage Gundel_1]|uniref:Uncharacterized protein n=1 Tax=Tenacibaculum phage Gundel_1 TaxID=2745672 RepID=A0A8E4ZK76_9CAUD|nr:hypothetical protein M1M25_gp081 [Tenacibaculum phage Gundel_1]QQV91518.1 hypothetical protein Gundel1_81 [Tenacibaculum phage Gundel_1]